MISMTDMQPQQNDANGRAGLKAPGRPLLVFPMPCAARKVHGKGNLKQQNDG